MGNLSSTDLKWLEDHFYCYAQYATDIQRRRFDLNFKPENKTPEIQKQPSQESPTENFIVKIMTDEYITDRERWRCGVEEVYREVDEDLRKLIQCKFFDSPYLSWEEAGDRLHHSKSKVYRMRYSILHKLAKAIKYR